MVMEEPDANTGQRTRVGESGAPIGSALSIVLAVVAVVIGFFILRQINDEGGTSATGAGVDTTRTETDDPGDDEDDPGDDENGEPRTTEPSAPQNVFRGAQVVVANANREPGSAGEMRDQIVAAGFSVPDDGSAIDTTDGQAHEQTIIYFRPRNENARSVAETVARAFGDESIPIQRYSDDIPIDHDGFNGAVLVFLGLDHVDTDVQRPAEPGAGAPAPGDQGDDEDEGGE